MVWKLIGEETFQREKKKSVLAPYSRFHTDCGIESHKAAKRMRLAH